MTNSANFRNLRATLLFTVLSGAFVLFVLWSSGALPLLLRPWFLAGLGLLLVLATLVTRKSTRDDDGNRPAGPFFTELLLELRQNLLELAVLSLPAHRPPSCSGVPRLTGVRCFRNSSTPFPSGSP